MVTKYRCVFKSLWVIRWSSVFNCQKKRQKKGFQNGIRCRGIITFLPKMGSRGGGIRHSPFLWVSFYFIILLILSFFLVAREAPRIHHRRGKERYAFFYCHQYWNHSTRPKWCGVSESWWMREIRIRCRSGRKYDAVQKEGVPRHSYNRGFP